MIIRICRDDEREEILSIINAAAEAHHGVIPADCWHDPYMSGDELNRELAAPELLRKASGDQMALGGTMKHLTFGITLSSS
jgi:hypothetical protein